ncbi:MAG: alpha/beta fold hydrolase [Acidimicrobiales bacterium]
MTSATTRSADPRPEPEEGGPEARAGARAGHVPNQGILACRSAGEGPRLVLAHGFTQTGQVWGGLDRELARERSVVQVDLPGHGGSAAFRTSVPDGGDLLARTGGAGCYLGYSMGARFCLQVALDHPGLVDRLVLISGTAGIDSSEERRLRRRADERLAEQLDPTDGSVADTVESFLRRWMANPLFGSIPPERDGFAERCTNSGPGLASSLRLAGTGTQRPLWDRLGSLDLPVLIVCGERDAKYAELGRRMVDAIGARARQVVVPGTDHAPHLQAPGSVGNLVRTFLDEGA